MTQPTMIQNRKTQADVLAKGFGVQKDMLEMQSKMPPPGQNYIDMFSGMRDSVGFKQRPRSPWRAALDGMFKGLEVGAKIGKNSEAKERYQKLEQFGEYIEENQRALNKDLAAEQKKIATNDSLGKIADPLFLMSKSGASPDEMNRVSQEHFEMARDHGFTIETRDPQTGELKASTEEFIPKGASFRSVDPVSLTVTYVKPDGTTGYFDLGSKVTPGAIEKHKLNLEEKSLTERSRRNDLMDKDMQRKQQDSDGKRVALTQKELQAWHKKDVAMTRSTTAVNSILHEVENNPEAFASWATYTVETGGQGSISDWAKKNALPPETTKTLEKVNKYFNQLAVDEATAFPGRQNIFLEKLIRGGLPAAQMTADSITELLHEQLSRLKFESQGHMKIARSNLMIKDTAEDLRKDSDNFIAEEQTKIKQGAAKQLVTVRINGELGTVPKDQLKAVLDDGGEFVE